MNIKQPYNQFVLFFLLLTVAFGCRKMDATYSAFLKGGEKVYTVKADSLQVHSGKERIMLSWLLVADPKVSAYKIYWNNRRDSVEGKLVKSENIDTVKVLIANLPEGMYNFEVFQYDEHHNSSVGVVAMGKSYGQQYLNSLLNRAYRSIARNGRNLEITWMPSEETTKEIHISYKNMNSSIINKDVSELENQTVLVDFPYGGSFTYTTTYRPDSLSLDNFTTEAVTETEKLEEMELPKSKWSNFPLPTDTYKSEFPDWKIENLWDGKTDVSPYFFYVDPNIPGLQLPNWFTLDLGEKYKLKSIRVNQLSHATAWMYNYGAPKSFEVYGSANPPGDGSWNNWVLLGQYESVKPSNLPLGALSSDDIARAKSGEVFQLDAQAAGCRYIRFKVISTWGGFLNPMISELTIRGFYATE